MPPVLPPHCLCTDPQQLRRLLPVYKPKQREGVVERVEGDGCTAVCRGMFGRDTDLALFIGGQWMGDEMMAGVGQGSRRAGSQARGRVGMISGLTAKHSSLQPPKCPHPQPTQA